MKFKCKCGSEVFSIHNETNTTFHGEITSLEFNNLKTDKWFATCLDCKTEWGPNGQRRSVDVNNESFIAIILNNQEDVNWLNECYKNVGTEEMLPIQHVPHDAFYGKTSPYTTIRLINAKQLPLFTTQPNSEWKWNEDPYKYYLTLTAMQPILDLFVTNLKEKLTVLRWPWKVTMVEI